MLVAEEIDEVVVCHMIQDVDETLRQFLLQELAGKLLPEAEMEVLFDLPQEGETSSTTRYSVNLYLHDIRENLIQREEFYRLRRSDSDLSRAGRWRAPVRVDLAYLLTVRASEGRSQEHMLLARVLEVLLQQETVKDWSQSPKSSRYLQGCLAEQIPCSLQLTVADADHPSHIDSAALWRSLRLPIRPSITLVASVLFDPFEPHYVPVVRHALLAAKADVRTDSGRQAFEINSTMVSLAGVVTAKGSGLPLGGVRVRVDELGEEAMTDDLGLYYFTDLKPGTHPVVFELRGFEERTEQAVLQPQMKETVMVAVELSPRGGMVRETLPDLAAGIVEHDRRRTVTLSGRLMFESGRPAAYVPVQSGGRRAITDESGVYTLSGLPPGEHEVYADVPGKGEVKVQTGPGGEYVALSQKNSKVTPE